MKKTIFSFIFLLSSIAGQAGLQDLAPFKAGTEDPKKNKKLVMFWASWCTTCKDKLANSLPALNQKPDVTVITVNMDKEAKRAENYIEKNKVALSVYLDPEKKLRNELQIFSVPHWAVYQRESEKAEWKLVKSEAAFENDHINQALGGKYL